MLSRFNPGHRTIPLILGLATLGLSALLLVWDAFPGWFPAHAHDVLAALSLSLIAFAYLLHQVARRPAPRELIKAILLAVAFVSWAANQLWPDLPQATLFNDIAVALFVLDLFLVIGTAEPAATPARRRQ